MEEIMTMNKIYDVYKANETKFKDISYKPFPEIFDYGTFCFKLDGGESRIGTFYIIPLYEMSLRQYLDLIMELD